MVERNSAIEQKPQPCWRILSFPMRKPHPPPVIIDNWPHPPIVLDYEDPKPRRVCGVFCIVADRWAKERGIYRGSYFSNIKAAFKATGFRRDEVGKLLRKNRGTRLEGYAIFEEAWFTTAKFKFKRRSRDFAFWLRREFPWLLEKTGSAASKPRRKLVKPRGISRFQASSKR